MKLDPTRFLFELKRIFSLDLRSISLFRWILGLILLVDIIQRSFDLYAHYTDMGVYPRIAMIQHDSGPAIWSLHLINGSLEFNALLFSAQILASFLFMIGYRAKLTGFITWVLLVSLQARNPIVNQGGDLELRLLLLWSLFLPIDKIWTTTPDSFFRFPFKKALKAIKAQKNNNTQHLSAGSVIFLFQIFAVYFFSALLKTSPTWRETGTALNLALQLDQFTLPLGKLLLEHKELVNTLGLGVWYWELLGPFLLLIPFINPWTKLIFVLGTIGLHAGIASTMAIGNFSFICMSAAIPFIPSELWSNSLQIPKKAFQFTQHHMHYGLQALAIFLFSLGMLWNIAAFPSTRWMMPSLLRNLALIPRVDQLWNMFSPFPSTEDGWYVIPGVLESGEPVDVYNFKIASPSFEKPKWVYTIYPNFRWRKYMMNLWLKDYSTRRVYLAQYYCREWNKNRALGTRLASFEIYYVLEKSLPTGPDTPKPIKIWDHRCF